MTIFRAPRLAPLVRFVFFSKILLCALTANAEVTCDQPQDEFREIFARAVSSRHASEQVATYLYGLPPPLAAAGEAVSSSHEMLRTLSKWQPSALQREGGLRQICAETSSRARHAVPVTLVLFPPLAAEFCSSLPFGDVLARTESAMARRWRAVSRSGLHRFESFSLNSLRTESLALDELVEVSSIDDEQGRPRITLVYLKPPRGSLESLGSPERTVARFLPRLEAALSLLEVEGPLHLVGYSRGANLALEAVRRAHLRPDLHTWVRSVRSVVSVAGVNFGSLAADDAERSGTPIHELLATVRWLANALEDEDPRENPISKAAKVARNGGRWSWALARTGAQLAAFPVPGALRNEALALDVSPSEALWKTLMSSFFDVFELDRPVSDYFGNVRRFKIFVNAFFESVEALTSAERERWWKWSALPEDLHLVGIGATMGDSWNPSAGLWPLAMNPLVASPRSLDFSFLRLAYHHMIGHSNAPLNDGLVSLDRTLFWPGLLRSLTGREFRTTHLAIFGVDHFALGHAMASPAPQSRRNPFPQEALIESLGEWLGRGAR